MPGDFLDTPHPHLRNPILYVVDVPKRIKWHHLASLFAPCGAVTSRGRDTVQTNQGQVKRLSVEFSDTFHGEVFNFDGFDVERLKRREFKLRWLWRRFRALPCPEFLPHTTSSSPGHPNWRRQLPASLYFRSTSGTPDMRPTSILRSRLAHRTFLRGSDMQDRWSLSESMKMLDGRIRRAQSSTGIFRMHNMLDSTVGPFIPLCRKCPPFNCARMIPEICIVR